MRGQKKNSVEGHANKSSRTHILARLWQSQDGNMMMIGTFGLLIIMGILALSVDHGRNYLEQADLEAKLTAHTKYAAKEYTEWYIDQEIKQRYGKPSDSNKRLLKVNDSQSAALNKLKNFVSNKVFAGPIPSNACIGNPRIRTNTNNKDSVLEFYIKQAQSSRFAMNDKDKKKCNCSAAAPTAEGGCILVQSGVTVPPFPELNNPDFIAQSVISLDIFSETKIGNAVRDLVTKAEVIMKEVVDGEVNIWSGVQKGNIPSCVSDGKGTPDKSLNCKQAASMGWSGGAYDNNAALNGAGAANARNLDQSRKHPVLMSIDGQYTRTCAKTVWTYETEEAGRCSSSYVNTAAGTCAANFPWGWGPIATGVASATDTTDPVTGEPTCDYTLWQPMVIGKWVKACARDQVRYNSPSSKINRVTAKFIGKNTPLSGDFIFTAPLAAVTLNGTEGAGGVGGGQGSTEFKKLMAKNTDKSFPHACDTRNRPDGAWGLPFGHNYGRPVINDASTGLSGVDKNNCTFGAFNAGGSYQTVNFEYRFSTAPGVGNFPEGLYEVRMQVGGLNGGEGAGAEPSPAEFAAFTPPSGPGWAYKGIWNAQFTPHGGACPAPNGCLNCAPYVKSSYTTGGIPPERLNIASAMTEFGRDEDGNLIPGLLDSYDYDVNNGEIHPEGSPPVMNNDHGDGHAAPIGSGSGDPFFFRPGSPDHLIEQPVFNAPHSSRFGIMSLTGSFNDIVGWWPDGVVSCEKDPKKPRPNWCYVGIPVVNLNTVKDFREIRWYEDRQGGKTGKKLSYSIKGAQNLSPKLGPVAFDNMIKELKRGYDDYGIFNGHNGNQCAVLKAGLAQALSVTGSDMRRGLIFIGSCPPANWNHASMNFENRAVNWFANGNTAGKPGALSEPYLQAMNKPGGALKSQTLQCFNQVKGQVDAFLVLTDSSCPEFEALSSDFGIGGTGNCDLNVPSTLPDCIKNFVMSTLPLEGREARKR